MRTLVPFAVILSVVAFFYGCSDPVQPDDPVTIIDGPAYFPMHDGDTWYYNSSIIRKVDGDTTVNGIQCKRVFLGTETDQAWTVDSQGFAQHLFEGYLWFDPPLRIPFNMKKGVPFNFSSLGRISDAFESDADSIRTAGSLHFDGYVSRVRNNVTLDSCLKFDYSYIDKIYKKNGTVIEDTSSYSEVWAKGIGMIEDGDWFLDLAVINGVELPKRAK